MTKFYHYYDLAFALPSSDSHLSATSVLFPTKMFFTKIACTLHVFGVNPLVNTKLERAGRSVGRCRTHQLPTRALHCYFRKPWQQTLSDTWLEVIARGFSSPFLFPICPIMRTCRLRCRNRGCGVGWKILKESFTQSLDEPQEHIHRYSFDIQSS